MGIANNGFVLGVDVTISIGVFKNIFAHPLSWNEVFVAPNPDWQYRHSLTVASCTYITCHLVLGLIEANDIITEELGDGLALFGHCHVSISGAASPKSRSGQIVQTNHVVFVGRDIDAKIIAELTDGIAVGKGEIPALILHAAQV